MQSDLPRAFLSACVRQELWKFILEFSGLFYCSIIKVQGLYPTSLLPTRCLRQRYISYHLCFSLSRTFLFYFLKFFQKIKSLEIFKRFLNFSLSHLTRKSLAFQLYFLIALLWQRYLSYNIFSTLSRTFFILILIDMFQAKLNSFMSRNFPTATTNNILSYTQLHVKFFLSFNWIYNKNYNLRHLHELSLSSRLLCDSEDYIITPYMLCQELF